MRIRQLLQPVHSPHNLPEKQMLAVRLLQPTNSMHLLQDLLQPRCQMSKAAGQEQPVVQPAAWLSRHCKVPCVGVQAQQPPPRQMLAATTRHQHLLHLHRQQHLPRSLVVHTLPGLTCLLPLQLLTLRRADQARGMLAPPDQSGVSSKPSQQPCPTPHCRALPLCSLHQLAKLGQSSRLPNQFGSNHLRQGAFRMSKAGTLSPLQEDHQLLLLEMLVLREAALCNGRAASRGSLGLQAIQTLPLLEGGGPGKGSPERHLLTIRHLPMLWLMCICLTEAAIAKQAHSKLQLGLPPLLTVMQPASQRINHRSTAWSQADSPQDNLARHWLMHMQSTRHRQGGTSAAQDMEGKQKYRPLLHQTLLIIMQISSRHKARPTVGGT